MNTAELNGIFSLESIKNNNHLQIDQFKKNKLIKLIHSDDIKISMVRDRLLDCIQVLSNYFQKVVLIRNAFCHNPKYIPITRQHLQEEFMHDVSLGAERNGRPQIWDPILEGTCSWFA